MNEKEDKLITELVETGAELSGSIGGSVIGALIAGVPGAIVGGVFGPVITKSFKAIGLEIKKRVMGDREAIRIGAGYTFALSKIKQKIDAGEKPREDGYFEAKDGKRAVSEEILEGALLIAQKEYEEFKVKHYGYLIANISFDPKIDRGYANFLLRMAEKLSYRQLCLLELFNDTKKYELLRIIQPPQLDTVTDPTKIFIRSHSGMARVPLKNWKADLASEIEEMIQFGLLELDSLFFENYSGGKLLSPGKELRDLMELNELDVDDVEEIATLLRTTQEDPLF